MITINHYGDKFFVFDAKDVERLRCEYRIVGAFSGTLPQYPLQNTFYGLPLLLLPEEVSLITHNGWGNVVSKKKPMSPSPNEIFNDLWSKGFYITSGIKFGGDYLLYTNDPMCTHSEFIIGVRQEEEDIKPVEIISMGRLATNVKKTFVVAGSIQEMMTYYSIEWAGF
ncbi:uncharacterized protein EV154DRAFT_562368 [Mucor mucedo]|uniref:uncharacterized protein n=1 Tax=Mucor mucedo TaxID=29922 RepID=UPI002221299A|nr:uncharacterized protein EV154DRAFT_562368 [Mucor mucedo]KAI7892392.1 hypothetical protein EV154DRAFT_562368 [Mucor mucedo]